MKKQIFILLLFIGLFSACGRHSESDKYAIIAETGKNKVTLDEFRNRLEFTPRIYRYGDDTANKEMLLASLLNEKIMAELAVDKNYDTQPFPVEMINQLEKEAIVEALFDKEVDQKVKIEEAEIRRAYVRSKQELKVAYFITGDQETADLASEQIKQSEPFEVVAARQMFNNPAMADSIPIKQLKWGDARPVLEDSLFQLPIGKITGPINVDGVYYFFKMLNKRSDVLFTENEYQQKRPSLKKKIRQRYRTSMFNEFIFQLMHDTKVTIPRERFKLLAEKLEAAMNIEVQGNPEMSSSNQLLQNDYLKIESELKDYLDEPFADFSNGSTWTINDVLAKLRVGPYPLDYKSKAKFRSTLKHNIKFMIEFEKMTAEGRRQNLAKSEYVREETRVWRDNILANQLRQHVLDSLYQPTESDYKQFYTDHTGLFEAPAMIKIQEVLVNDSTLAVDLKRRIQNGAAISGIAKKYSKRELSAARGGHSGWFTVGSWGKIGTIAFRAQKGKICGPVKTSEGQFSVFRV
ncbi:peptidylprolyl isomerase, partial [bacterium]|nr:peptidylprolyl isomerase [bacterium]